MRITAIITFVAVVHIGSASIAAQQPTDGLPPKAAPFGNVFAPPSKPASPQRFLFPTPAPDVRVARKPTVVCGLTLIPGDPNVDPGIRREIPEGGPRFSIGSVDPKLCRRP
mgnify:CR=1 FL=1